MKKILLGLLLLANTSYCQFVPQKVGVIDSVEVVSNLQSNWRYVGYYYMPISTNQIIKHPSFIFNDNLIVTPNNDTFVNFHYIVEKVINKSYLHEYYDFKYIDTTSPSYVVSLSTKNIPYSIKCKCNNPHYTLQCEFLFYSGNLYYDKDGVVYKFIKK